MAIVDLSSQTLLPVDISNVDWQLKPSALNGKENAVIGVWQGGVWQGLERHYAARPQYPNWKRRRGSLAFQTEFAVPLASTLSF